MRYFGVYAYLVYIEALDEFNRRRPAGSALGVCPAGNALGVRPTGNALRVDIIDIEVSFRSLIPED